MELKSVILVIPNIIISLIFFQRMENHLLRNKFNSKKISTQKFIDWALENRLLRQNVDEV